MKNIDMALYDNGGAIPCANIKKFIATHLPLPPLEEQQAIVAYIEEKCKKIDALVEALEAEIEQLKEYKQSLIADCVTGKIKV
jgi:restriction endonuclease S subunit